MLKRSRATGDGPTTLCFLAWPEARAAAWSQSQLTCCRNQAEPDYVQGSLNSETACAFFGSASFIVLLIALASNTKPSRSLVERPLRFPAPDRAGHVAAAVR